MSDEETNEVADASEAERTEASEDIAQDSAPKAEVEAESVEDATGSATEQPVDEELQLVSRINSHIAEIGNHQAINELLLAGHTQLEPNDRKDPYRLRWLSMANSQFFLQAMLKRRIEKIKAL